MHRIWQVQWPTLRASACHRHSSNQMCASLRANSVIEPGAGQEIGQQIDDRLYLLQMVVCETSEKRRCWSPVHVHMPTVWSIPYAFRTWCICHRSTERLIDKGEGGNGQKKVRRGKITSFLAAIENLERSEKNHKTTSHIFDFLAAAPVSLYTMFIVIVVIIVARLAPLLSADTTIASF